MRLLLNFSNFYNKLLSDEYTTIRRKESYNSFQIDDIIEIHINHIFDHNAILTHKELKSINELSLDFLIKDSEYNNNTIKNKEEFLNLLNIFYTGKNKIRDLNEPLTIFYLQKIKK